MANARATGEPFRTMHCRSQASPTCGALGSGFFFLPIVKGDAKVGRISFWPSSTVLVGCSSTPSRTRPRGLLTHDLLAWSGRYTSDYSTMCCCLPTGPMKAVKLAARLSQQLNASKAHHAHHPPTSHVAFQSYIAAFESSLRYVQYPRSGRSFTNAFGPIQYENVP